MDWKYGSGLWQKSNMLIMLIGISNDKQIPVFTATVKMVGNLVVERLPTFFLLWIEVTFWVLVGTFVYSNL